MKETVPANNEIEQIKPPVKALRHIFVIHNRKLL